MRLQEALHFRMAAPVISMTTPGTDHHIGAVRGLQQSDIVIRADRMRVFLELSRVRCAIGEDIDNLKGAISHIDRPAVASLNSWIIAEFVSG